METYTEAIDYRRLGEDSNDLIIAFDSSFRYTYVNPPVLRLIKKTREQLLGRTMWEVAPHMAGTKYETYYVRAMTQRTIVEFEDHYPPLDQWNLVRCVPQADGGLIVFAQNTTAQHRAQSKLQESLALLNAVIDGTSDMVAAIDVDRRFLIANKAVADFMGFETTEELIGRSDFELLTDPQIQEVLQRLKSHDDEVMRSGNPVSLEFVTDVVPQGKITKAFISNKAPLRDPATGAIVGLVNIIHDITERRNRERRQRFVSELTERTRLLHDPEEVLDEVVDAAGRFLNVGACTYGDVDLSVGTYEVISEWRRDGVPIRTGMASLSSVSPKLLQSAISGCPLVVNNADDPEWDDDRPLMSALGVSSMILVPIIKDGAWVGFLSVQDTSVRLWQSDEIELLKLIADQTWLTLENARLFRDSQLRAERESFLSTASSLLNATLDYQATLGSIAKLAVPKFADWCAIDTVAADGISTECVVFEHVDPTKIPLGWKMRQLYPHKVGATRGAGWVMSSGVSHFHPVITEEQMIAGTANSEQHRLLKTMGFDSAMVVPISARGRIYGAITMAASADSMRTFNIQDLQLAEELARRAATAIENSLLFAELKRSEAKHRRIANTLQSSLLIPIPKDGFAGVEVDGHYEVALDEAFVGGDYGDAFQLDSTRIALLVGDCTGKGLEAARFVGECQFTARAFLRSRPDDPAAALRLLNRMLIDGQLYDGRPPDALTSLIIAVIDSQTGKTTIAAGGSEPPIVLRADTGIAEELPAHGTLLGIDDSAVFHSVTIELAPGDMIVLTTDGTTEARNRTTRQFYGNERLVAAVKSIAANHKNVQGFANKIIDDVKQFAGGELTDDACILVARRIALDTAQLSPTE